MRPPEEDPLSDEYLKKSIKEFKERIKKEPEVCMRLFKHTEIHLMAMKYAYYVVGIPYVKDVTYDGVERSWYIMGRALGILNENETSPCVGFDENHKYAKRARLIAYKLRKRKDE